MLPPSRAVRSTALVLMTLAVGSGARPEDRDWLDLSGLDAWKSPVEGWATAGSVGLDPKDDRKLAATPGSGVLYNGPTGRARNLVSQEEFGDVEVHVEFCLPRGSNSGVKF